MYGASTRYLGLQPFYLCYMELERDPHWTSLLPPLPAQMPLSNKFAIILQSSDLDILKGYNPTIRMPMMFSLFTSQTTLSWFTTGFLLMLSAFPPWRDRQQLKVREPWLWGGRAVPQATKAISGSISWAGLRQEGQWSKDCILRGVWKTSCFSKFCYLWKFPQHLSHWIPML